jgi:hypothetical protein
MTCEHDYTITECNNWGECFTICEDCGQQVQVDDEFDPEPILIAKDEASQAAFDHRWPT